MQTFSDYEAAAVSTAIYPGQGEALGLIYCSLKGAGEAGEFVDHLIHDGIDDLMIKEIGDELWYCAAKARELDTTLAVVCDDIDEIAEFERHKVVSGVTMNFVAMSGAALATQFCEQVGKALRDDNLADAELVTDRRDKLIELLRLHMVNLAYKAYLLKTSLASIAEGNIEKLAKRKEQGTLGGSGDNR